MADFMFNTGKGKVAEFLERVENNLGANSAIVAIPMSASGTEAQGQDLATMAAIEADANFAEQTASGWARVTWTDADLAAADFAPDNTNNRGIAHLPQKSFGSPTAGAITGVVFCFDEDTTSGTDSNLIPISHHTASLTGNSNEVVFQAGDIGRAS
jgi:hypothetical protein